MRHYINLVEAVQKGCPRATHDITLNLKNRQKAIDDYHYGPANPLEPGDYWKQAADQWHVSEKIIKTMKCGNCAAFDASDTMRRCIESGIQGDDFKCAGSRSCAAFVVGGPITEKDRGQKAN